MMWKSKDFHHFTNFLFLVLFSPRVNSLQSLVLPITQNVVHEDAKLFDLGLKTQVAKLNSSYKMKCLVKVPGLTFWTVDGRAPDGSKFKILSDSNLVIRNISEEDFDREYLCHALIHGRPMVESMQIFLEPFFTEKDRDKKSLSIPTEPTFSKEDYSIATKIKFGLVGVQTTLSCTAQGRPYPTFTWLHANGTIIQNRSDFTITTNHEDVSNLTIFLRDTNHYGKKYYCEAWNTRGKSEQAFLLQMPEKPREIPFLFPKVIGTNKIGLGLTLENVQNFSSLHIIIQFRKIGDATWNETSVDGSAEYLTLQGLEVNSTYLIRAAVKNEFVVGSYSEPILVTTDKEMADNEGSSISGRGFRDPVNDKAKQGFGRSLQSLDGPGLKTSDDFTKKAIVSKTWSSKWITKIGNKLIITTNTSIVEEQEVYNVPNSGK